MVNRSTSLPGHRALLGEARQLQGKPDTKPASVGKKRPGVFFWLSVPVTIENGTEHVRAS